MSSYSEGNDFEDILARLLANVDNSLDKRQGSIIYDALAPAAAELAQAYIALDVYQDQTYLLTAVGENLDNRVADYGLKRKEATYSKRIAVFKDTENNNMEVDIGSRFAVPNEYGGYNYIVSETTDTVGEYIITCETAGSVGDEYVGMLLPLESVNNLGSAEIIGTYLPAEDIETDEELRERTLNALNKLTFGGNIADYKNWVENIDGIGICKVIPIWNGGGTVKILVIASDYSIPNESIVADVQQYLDPIEHTGKGYGIAPIGHQVTVQAPIQLDVNISGDIFLKSGFSLDDVQENIKNSIKTYLRQVQNEWKDAETLTIYVARIISAILSVNGVNNIENVTINGENENLIITQTDTDNYYPILGEVIFNEN